jgi:hypothetical protein
VVGLVLGLGACKGSSAKRAETWPADLGGATKWVSEQCGQPTKPLQGLTEGGGPVVTKGFAVDCERKKAEALLDRAHGPLRERGLYLFLAEQSFGIGGKPDTLGVLPTRDP